MFHIFQIIAHFPDLKTRPLLKCFAFSRLLRISRFENEATTQMFPIFQIIAHFPDLKTRPLLKCFTFSRLLRIFQIYVYLNVPQIPDSSAVSRLFRTFKNIPQFSQRFRKFQLAYGTQTFLQELYTGQGLLCHVLPTGQGLFKITSCKYFPPYPQ